MGSEKAALTPIRQYPIDPPASAASKAPRRLPFLGTNPSKITDKVLCRHTQSSPRLCSCFNRALGDNFTASTTHCAYQRPLDNKRLAAHTLPITIMAPSKWGTYCMIARTPSMPLPPPVRTYTNLQISCRRRVRRREHSTDLSTAHRATRQVRRRRGGQRRTRLGIPPFHDFTDSE